MTAGSKRISRSSGNGNTSPCIYLQTQTTRREDKAGFSIVCEAVWRPEPGRTHFPTTRFWVFRFRVTIERYYAPPRHHLPHKGDAFLKAITAYPQVDTVLR